MVSITNVEIRNFRNIKSASFDLKNRCAVEGHNALGKTNILEAICFALTNYLLDGSSDLKSIKPKDEMNAKVSVKLTFSNERTFEKVYYENWVKTRGTEEIKLVGHTTEYYIDGAKISSVANAQKQLMEDILEINYSPKTSKIDILQMQLNPLWLFKYIDWSVLRKYIIELVGDVKDDEVLNEIIKNYDDLSLFNTVKGDLLKNNYKTDIVLNLYKNFITSSKQQINIYEHSISEDEKISDVDENVYQETLLKKDELMDQKQKLINSKNSIVNPLVAQFEKEIVDLQEEYNNQRKKDLEDFNNSNKSITAKIIELQDTFNNVSTAYDSHISVLKEKADAISKEENSKLMIEKEIQDLENSLADLRRKYDEVYSKTFNEVLTLPEEMTCPHCGGIVNESYINEIRTNYEYRKNAFEESINSELIEIEKKAKEINLKIESKKFNLVEINTKIHQLMNEYGEINTIVSKYSSSKSIALNDLKIAQQQMPIFKDSEEVIKLKSKIIDVQQKLINEKSRVFVNSDLEEQINNINAALADLEKIIDERKFYDFIQNKIADTKIKLNVELKKLNESEVKIMIVEDFIKTKLSLLNANIAEVFGNIEFVLVTSNIKDGSWNQECYPLIVGTSTPFEHGSRSEQYITAIAIVEKIKTLVGLPDIPYLIDEIGTFDSNTITNKLVTGSQIIASRMNNDFKVITVNEL